MSVFFRSPERSRFSRGALMIAPRAVGCKRWLDAVSLCSVRAVTAHKAVTDLFAMSLARRPSAHCAVVVRYVRAARDVARVRHFGLRVIGLRLPTRQCALSTPMGMNLLDLTDPAREDVGSVPPEFLRQFKEPRPRLHVAVLMNHESRDHAAACVRLVP